MKKFLLTVLTACAVVLAGCNLGGDSTPSIEKVSGTAKLIGTTAGYACELTNTKAEVKESIILVMTNVANVVPGTNETFTTAWTPLIDTEVKKLVDGKRLNDSSAAIVKSALGVACSGIDFVFSKYPTARKYEDIVSAAIVAFVDGFTSVVGNPTKLSSSPGGEDKALADEFVNSLKKPDVK